MFFFLSHCTAERQGTWGFYHSRQPLLQRSLWIGHESCFSASWYFATEQERYTLLSLLVIPPLFPLALMEHIKCRSLSTLTVSVHLKMGYIWAVIPLPRECLDAKFCARYDISYFQCLWLMLIASPCFQSRLQMFCLVRKQRLRFCILSRAFLNRN